MLEAEAEVIMEMVGRREQPAGHPPQGSLPPIPATAPLAQPEDTQDDPPPPPPPPPAQAGEAEQGERGTPMDVDQPGWCRTLNRPGIYSGSHYQQMSCLLTS